jgi:transcriptional regulator with XRE-family HTH domain
MEPTEPRPGELLQAARLEMGLKASRLAGLLDVSETTVSRWENDHQTPRRRQQIELCRVLDKAPEELRFEEGLLDMDRRKFVRSITAALGTAATAPLLERTGPDSFERLAGAIRRPSRLDPTSIEHLEVVTAMHRELYHTLSSYELLGALVGHLQMVRAQR